MKMNTGNDYWPEWLVYLFGQMAYFPNTIGATILTIRTLAPGQSRDDSGKLLQLLIQMHEKGIIALTDIRIDQDYLRDEASYAISDPQFRASHKEKIEAHKSGLTPQIRKKIVSDKELNLDELAGAVQKLPVGYLDKYLRFQLATFNSEWFRTELEEYLQKFKNGDLTTGTPDDPHKFSKQLDLLVQSYWRESIVYGVKHNQKRTDIWRGSESWKQGRFWELILTAARDRYFNLLTIHQDSVPWVRIEALEAIKVHKTERQRVNESARRLISDIQARQAVPVISTANPSAAPAKPTNRWLDEAGGRYQFGEKVFEQKGAIRGKVFRALMNLHQKTPQALSISTLHEMTGLESRSIRIVIGAINKHMKLQNIGYKFVGSRKGYYTLDPVEKAG